MTSRNINNRFVIPSRQLNFRVLIAEANVNTTVVGKGENGKVNVQSTCSSDMYKYPLRIRP